MTLISLLPLDIKSFLSEIEELGVMLTVVGGASRDFFEKGILARDLDFEVRNVKIDMLESLIYAKGLSCNRLPYDILRVSFSGFDLEFSSPRLEIPIPENSTHHYFNVQLSEKLPYDKAFARRDFTINAIGIELDLKNNLEKVIDPFSGLVDLRQKILREISDDFFLDPVRFLRLLRFHLKSQYKISESITEKVGKFNLESLSIFHFKEEMRKSNSAGKFINLFNELIKKHQISLSPAFDFWSRIVFPDDLKELDELLVFSLKTDECFARSVASFFSMPEKKINDLISFNISFQRIKQFSRKELADFSKEPLAKIYDSLILKDLKNLEDKKEWRKFYLEVLPVSWDDWNVVIVTPEEINNTPTQERSSLRFYKTLRQLAM